MGMITVVILKVYLAQMPKWSFDVHRANWESWPCHLLASLCGLEHFFSTSTSMEKKKETYKGLTQVTGT